jgi:eukaryotic-like serine/threonine-protein kinase
MDLREQLQQTLTASYTIDRELGGGGMSRVFLAEETRLRRKVVVKVLSPDLAQGLSAERFEREIQVAASLQQANIVPVLSTGETGGIPYYTMPFIEGESLRSRLRDKGAMPIGEAVSVLRDVARALQFAHERGIVHRDIKPDNVLLSGATAVVTDFGIAKAIAASRADAGHEPTLTQLGTSIGTPAYISPEQAAGDPDIDHRSDIYSFGCMAYELLAGRPPFIAKTPQRLLAAHMGETPQPISELRPETPAPLSSMVMRCLEKDASARPQSATALLTALDAAQTSDSNVAPVPPILLGGRGMLRKALALYVVAFVVVAVVAKAAIVGIGLPDWVFPGSLIVMALGLPVILFTAYTQSVARRSIIQTPTFTPGGTPTHVPHGTMATIAMKAVPHMSWRRTAYGGAWAVGAFVVGIGGFMVLRALGIGPAGSLFAKGALAENERIIVADFAARTKDTTLGPVVTEAFRASLGQSQSLEVVQQTAIKDALRRMQRDPNSRVDFALAREMATREGIKAVVDGEVIGVGGSYTLSTRLVAAQTGDLLATFTERAKDDAGILPAIDRLSKAMRQRIGESLRNVQASSSLGQVTTPSLEALKKYVQGTDALSQTGEFAKGVRLLEEAIALDTGFAMAYRKLAVELDNVGGQTARVMELSQKAYDHQDRLSDNERFTMLGTYYEKGPKQDLAKAISAYESALDLNPKDLAALNNVGSNYRTLRQYEKATSFYQRAIAIDPRRTVFYTNLLAAQSALGELDSSRETVRQFIAAMPDTRQAYLAAFYLAEATGAYDSAAALAKRRLDASTGNALARQVWAGELNSIAELRGHVGEATNLASEFRRAGTQRGVASALLNDALDSIYMDLWYRGSTNASARLDAALRAHSLDSIPVAERPFPRLVELYSHSGNAERARYYHDAWEKTRAGVRQIADSSVRHVMLGDIALADKKYDDAVREYRLGDFGACPVCRFPDIGHAYDLAGNADSAIAVFTRFTQSKYAASARVEADRQYLAGTEKRLGELYDAKGDKQNAIAHYTRFVDLWKNADPVLQPKVEEVRKKLARLSTGG